MKKCPVQKPEEENFKKSNTVSSVKCCKEVIIGFIHKGVTCYLCPRSSSRVVGTTRDPDYSIGKSFKKLTYEWKVRKMEEERKLKSQGTLLHNEETG